MTDTHADEQLDAKAPAAPTLPPPARPRGSTSRDPVHEKSALVAGILSLLPGLGHIYDGLYLRGVTFALFMGLFAGLVEATDQAIFGFALVFTFAFNVVDAVRQARLITFGYLSDPAAGFRPTPLTSGQGAGLAGAGLFLLGLLAALQDLFGIDLSALVHLWFLVPMAFGGWLMWSAWRERVARSEPAGEELY